MFTPKVELYMLDNFHDEFLEDSVDVFYGTKGLKSIDYSNNGNLTVGNFVYLTRWRSQLMPALAGQCFP